MGCKVGHGLFAPLMRGKEMWPLTPIPGTGTGDCAAGHWTRLLPLSNGSNSAWLFCWSLFIVKKYCDSWGHRSQTRGDWWAELWDLELSYLGLLYDPSVILKAGFFGRILMECYGKNGMYTNFFAGNRAILGIIHPLSSGKISTDFQKLQGSTDVVTALSDLSVFSWTITWLRQETRSNKIHRWWQIFGVSRSRRLCALICEHWKILSVPDSRRLCPWQSDIHWKD